jgi:GNAT superfamily N-acetyltransferase
MITYTKLKEYEVGSVCDLILKVFHKHVAPEYSEKGIEKFLSIISPSRLIELNENEDSFVIVAREERKIIGMLAIREGNHVSLIFVDSTYQGKGIGRRLVEDAITICKERNPGIITITVCSSPNSQEFYEEIGFKAIDLEQDDNGLRYTPMERQLST